jgi:hypothetical protein
VCPVNSYKNINNKWITKGIRTSCKRKRELLLLCRHSDDLKLKNYYKEFCKILSKVIKAAKKSYYNKIILNYNNKMKCTWKIINKNKVKIKNDKGIHSIKVDNKVISNQNEIANVFNKYFISIANSVASNNNKHTSSNSLNNPINYLVNSFNRPFAKIKLQYASTYEVEKNY